MKTKYWYWIWKAFLGPSRLRRKFVKAFLIAGLIPLVLMGTLSFYLVNLTHRIDVTALEQNLARQVAIEIQKTLDEVLATFDFIVTYESFSPIAFNQQEFVLRDFFRGKGDPFITEASLICTTPQACTVGTETTRLIRVGKEIISAPLLQDETEMSHFIAADEGALYISSAIQEGDEIYVRIASPVLNKNNQTVAILTGKISLTNILANTISSVSLGETGYVYVINTDGQILSHTNIENIGKVITAFPRVKSSITLEETSLDASSVSTPYENISGELVTGSGFLLDELKLIAIAEWPRAETQGLIRTILWQVGVFSIFAIIILAGIASWLALKLIQPIAELRQGTSIIGGGNFDYKVAIKTGDELEDLGANLNKMAENLKGLREVQELRLRTDLLSENLKKEQELSKLKDQFITTVSHQFNTPLSVINWAVEAFDDPKLPKKKLKENAAVIAKSQRDIAAIVSDLVTLSDIGFKYQGAKMAPADIKKLIAKSLEYFASSSGIKKITIEQKIETDNTMVYMNEFTMSKAIDNLIDNAIAYSDEGTSITITVTGNDNELMFSVSDTGIGIPKKDQPSIFQQFFRARNAIQKKNVGTGLGLFIVKTIVEGHKGKLWFDSEEGKGSTFHISLPRKQTIEQA